MPAATVVTICLLSRMPYFHTQTQA